MPRPSRSHAMVSDAALGALTALGERLREARLRRNWTQEQTATKAGLSESSVKKVEAGSPRIMIGAYLSLLDVFGAPAAFDRVLAAGDDTLGEALSRNALRQRARPARDGSAATAAADEWEL
ncbi:MAG: helix-turn-helix transcriptional regulator [Pseudomonadales bacterium]